MIDLLQSQVHHPLHPDHAAEVQGQGEVQHRRKCLGAKQSLQIVRFPWAGPF